MNPIPSIDVETLLSIPRLGTQRLSRLIESQKTRLEEIEKRIDPSSPILASNILDIVPQWIKYTLLGVCMSILGLIIHCIFMTIRTKRGANGIKMIHNNSEYDVIRRTDTNIRTPATIESIQLPQQVLIPDASLPRNARAEYHNLLMLPSNCNN